MNAKLIILCGPPCTGKSTWSKEYIKGYHRTLRFNRDEMRFMLAGTPMLDVLGEHVITTMIDAGIKDALDSYRDVIVDQTNCKLSYINKFIKASKDVANIKIKIFKEDLELLFKRNKERAILTGVPRIPEHILTNMHHNQEIMLKSEEFKKLLEEYGEYLD